ncbi:MAG: type II toxin-antitoxin system VapC family toxin [Mariprofundus sp.]
MIYLDTSALLKLYVEESGTDQVKTFIGHASYIMTHLITYAEIRASLAKALRMHRIDSNNLLIKKQEIERDWQCMDILTPDETMIRRAADLAEQFGLRGYDSVHLAAVEMLHKQAMIPLTFVCFDYDLNKAASALGINTI